MRRLPTFDYFDVLAWEPCPDWQTETAERRMKAAFCKLGRPATALDVLDNEVGLRISTEHMIWTACHALPADYLPNAFEVSGRLPGMVLSGHAIYEYLVFYELAEARDYLRRDLRMYVAGDPRVRQDTVGYWLCDAMVTPPCRQPLGHCSVHGATS